jgi:K+ transporter
MEFINYVTENALVIIPVLYIIGNILKGTSKVSDKFIPVILLPIGIIFSIGVMKSISVDAVIQGVLVTGVTVYSNQIFKQISKE